MGRARGPPVQRRLVPSGVIAERACCARCGARPGYDLANTFKSPRRHKPNCHYGRGDPRSAQQVCSARRLTAHLHLNKTERACYARLNSTRAFCLNNTERACYARLNSTRSFCLNNTERACYARLNSTRSFCLNKTEQACYARRNSTRSFCLNKTERACYARSGARPGYDLANTFKSALRQQHNSHYGRGDPLRA